MGRRKAVVDFGVQSPKSAKKQEVTETQRSKVTQLSLAWREVRAHGDDEDRGGVDEAGGEQSAEVCRLAKSLSVTTGRTERKERRAFPFFPLSHKRERRKSC